MRRLLLLIALAGCGPDSEASLGEGDVAGDSEGAIRDRSARLSHFFPIAADFQPPSKMEEWKRRGVNTMIRVPGGVNVGEWTRRANDLGLKMIREPRENPRDDRDEAGLLAWHWRDEPELHQVPASEMADDVKKLRFVDPAMPVIVNFWGGGILQNHDGCFGSFCYRDYVKHADWVSDDIYPCNKYQCNIELVGRVVSQLRQWADGPREAFAYVETSDWDQNGSGPSPRRFRAEVWNAIIHGARGVFYFTVRLKPDCTSNCLDDYDGTPADVVDEMKKLHPLLDRLAPVLQRPVNPDGARIDVDGPLQAGWRQGPKGDWYFIVQNTEDRHVENAKLKLSGVHPKSADVIGRDRNARVNADNEIVDDFDPYEEHIYRVTK